VLTTSAPAGSRGEDCAAGVAELFAAADLAGPVDGFDDFAAPLGAGFAGVFAAAAAVVAVLRAAVCVAVFLAASVCVVVFLAAAFAAGLRACAGAACASNAAALNVAAQSVAAQSADAKARARDLRPCAAAVTSVFTSKAPLTLPLR
jgi:hypothetical protein